MFLNCDSRICYLTMELDALLVAGIQKSLSALPLQHLKVLVVVPALGLIKGHEEQSELSRVMWFVQCSFSAHQ